MKNRIQNAIRCVREIPIEVEDIVFSPIAAAQVVLNREAKQQGAILLDIGGGTTDYLMYVDGAIAASGSLGLGGDHVTNDLSIVLKIPLARAPRNSRSNTATSPTRTVPTRGSLTCRRTLTLPVRRSRRN